MIELLVVIAIIAILAAMLLPALAAECHNISVPGLVRKLNCAKRFPQNPLTTPEVSTLDKHKITAAGLLANLHNIKCDTPARSATPFIVMRSFMG